MIQRAKEQKKATENTNCKPPKKTPTKVSVSWATPEGHVDAFDGKWPTNTQGPKARRVHHWLHTTGTGPNARLRTLILTELRLSKWGINPTGSSIFNPKEKDGAYVKGMSFNYYSIKSEPNIADICEPVKIEGAHQISVQVNGQQRGSRLFGSEGCAKYVCLIFKVTKGKDAEGRLVRGWGALGTVKPNKLIELQYMNDPKAHAGGATMTGKCQKELNDFTLTVDAALRQAIAKFRFEVFGRHNFNPNPVPPLPQFSTTN